MADGLEPKVLLKLGIANSAATLEKVLPKYLPIYDVVISGDPPAWPLAEVIEKTCGEGAI